VISHDKAKLHELDTVYGLQDVYDMLEVIVVDLHNRNLVAEHMAKEKKS
jgi:hypothetical protein